MKLRLSALLLLPLLILIPGCAHYQTRELKHLQQETAAYQQTQSQITLRVTPLSKRDANALFDGRGSWLFSKKHTFYPIQITVFNKTNETIILSPENIGLKLAPKQAIIDAMKYDVGARTAIPLALGMMATFMRIACGRDYGDSAVLTTVDSVAIGTSSAMIAANENAASKDANAVLAEDIDQKILNCDGLIVKPFEKNTTLIFVEKNDCKNLFSVDLQSANGSIIPFDVII